MGYVYVGESVGGRILRYGQGYGQVGDGYQLEIKTWPFWAAGETGAVVFRRVAAIIRHTLGYSVTVTPIVDGMRLAPQTSSGGPPAAGAPEEIVACVAKVFRRGTKLEVEVATQVLSGETEVVDVEVTHIPIRGGT